MPDVIGPTLKLSIDARGAKAGAQQFKTATDGIARGGKQAAQATDKAGSSFKQLRNQTVALGRSLALLSGGAVGFSYIGG